MVRWFDGLYGGLIAGVTSAFFYAVVAVAWLHETTLAGFFAQVARALPVFRGTPDALPVVGLGVVLYFLLAGGLGVIYALLAKRLPSMWRAPTSVIWGLVYGLVVWFVLHDVLVPISGAIDVQPMWEGLVGTVFFYGVVLSELTTMAHRRGVDAAAP